VDYGKVSIFSPGTPPTVTGYAAMTSLAEEMISLFGLTLKSGYLGNPGSVNVIVPTGTIQFTAYGVFSDGSTKTMSPYIYDYGPCQFSSNNTEVMEINQTTGFATANQAGQASISANCGNVGFSPWIVTVQ
jgi:hypothetical protein